MALFFLKILALLDQRVTSRAMTSAAHIVTIERLTTPQPVRAAPARAHRQLKPQVVPSPRPQPVVRHELVSNRIVAKAEPMLPPSAVAPPKVGRPQLSPQQIERIERGMAAAIADDRAGINPVRVAAAPLATPKHFAADFTAFDGAIGRHHGLCDPTTSWHDEGWDYYYVSCNVHFPDGHIERQAVPWPIRFEPRDDPFAGTTRGQDRPLAPPLQGWHLEPGQTVSDQLRDYALSRGVAIQ